MARELGLDLRLLAIGMSSEGIAVERDREAFEWGQVLDAELRGTQIHFLGDPDPRIDTEFHRDGWKAFFYNRNWQVDGTDTFAMSFEKLRERGYLPPTWQLEKITPESRIRIGRGGADLVVDFSKRNENAIERYRPESLSLPFFERPRQSPTTGDPGMIFYRTPEIQARANAALWKYQIDLFHEARATILANLPKIYLDSNRRDRAREGLLRPLTREEEVFWAKVFFNAAQGTQAASYNFLVDLAGRGLLSTTAYLVELPTDVPRRVLYDNARYVLDSYLYAEAIQCP
jgi:hypothetical protein